MFKPGDRVQCIKPNNEVILGNVYTVSRCYHEKQADFVSLYDIYDDYFSWRFVSIKEIRKEKIKKLNHV